MSKYTVHNVVKKYFKHEKLLSYDIDMSYDNSSTGKITFDIFLFFTNYKIYIRTNNTTSRKIYNDNDINLLYKLEYLNFISKFKLPLQINITW